MFVQCLKKNIEMVETGVDKRGFGCPSFYHSVAGLYTTAAMYYNMVKDKEQTQTNVAKLIGLYSRFENDMGVYVEDEVLYGNSGYLYCLLLILKEIDPEN